MLCFRGWEGASTTVVICYDRRAQTALLSRVERSMFKFEFFTLPALRITPSQPSPFNLHHLTISLSLHLRARLQLGLWHSARSAGAARLPRAVLFSFTAGDLPPPCDNIFENHSKEGQHSAVGDAYSADAEARHVVEGDASFSEVAFLGRWSVLSGYCVLQVFVDIESSRGVVRVCDGVNVVVAIE